MNPLTLDPELPTGPIPMPTDRDLPSDDSGGEPLALLNLPKGTDLPYDDGEPMESPWHRDNMMLLLDSINTHWRDRTDFYAGGNMFVYFSSERVFGKDFRGPDFFVVKGVERYRPRVSWVVWEEGGMRPNVIVEFISPTTAAVDRGVKKLLYESIFRTHEYFCYDPLADRLEGWRLDIGTGYEPLTPDATGRMWSNQLGLSLGTWDGTFCHHTARWLRLFEANGQVVATDKEVEAAGRAAEAAARAATEAENARLRQELAALRQQSQPPTAS